MTELATPLSRDDNAVERFVHAADGHLLDGRNEPVLLRGVGLGNWLLPEGYMWKFRAPSLQSPRQIEAFVVDLVGSERAAAFWAEFRARYVAEADVAQVAAEGMNHVRLPINSRTLLDESGDLLPEGFAPIDRLIEWCRAHGLWVVLDLHGAPGGQTGTNIDDSPNGLPELFLDSRWREPTIRLWRALAQRYRDETAIAGYDLLNEPLPNDYQHTHASELVSLYRELTVAIREVDPHHLLIYEGTHWSTNWDVFTEVWDANSMLSFHKYWSPPDRPSIQTYLDVSGTLGLPVYMGEGGENGVGWVQTAFQLYEDNGISWNFWPWKKIDTRTSPCSVNAPRGWEEILAYGDGTGAKPEPDDAWGVLSELLEGLAFGNCTYRSELMSGLLRKVPLCIPAASFGFRGRGISYETSGSTPLAGFRSDDQVTVRLPGDRAALLSFDYSETSPRDAIVDLAVDLLAGDWIAYDIDVEAPTHLIVSVKRDGEGRVALSLDGTPLDTNDGVTVAAGRHVLRLECLAARATIYAIEVQAPTMNP